MNTRVYTTDSSGPVANHVAFNNDCKYFSVGLENGFAIYTSETCELRMEQELNNSVRMAKMMESSQMIGLLMAETRVGGDRVGKLPKLMLWDSAKKKEVAAISTANKICGIALTKTHIATVLDTAMVLYKHQPKMERVAQYETTSNPLGLCCLGRRILVIPGRSIGQIQIIDIETQSISIIPAHTSRLRALAISRNGEMIASTSDKGTLVRVHSSSTCARLCELRRGVTPAKIFSVAFSPSGSRLAVTSDTNTLHIFELPLATNPGHQGRAAPSSSTEIGSSKVDNENPSTGLNPFQKWGGLAKLPFAPRVFTDIYSFASTSFDSGKTDPVPDAEAVANSSSFGGMPGLRNTRPKGLVGWVDEQVIAVISAGSDARYERFALMDDINNNLACVRLGWSRYLVPG